MNVIAAGPLIAFLIGFASAAAAIAAFCECVLRPRARALMAGGPPRYALALAIRALAFTLPFPFVWIWFLGLNPDGANVVIALVASYLAVTALRFLPLSGTLLKDLSLANRAALGPREARP